MNIVDRVKSLTLEEIITLLKDLPPEQVGGMTSAQEKLLLKCLAQALPAGSQIVEVGCFCGSSTAILAHAAPESTVTTIDPFDTDEKIYDKSKTKQSSVEQRTFESIQKRLSRFTNINIVKGTSPYVIKDWNTPIDLYFEDGDHDYPGLFLNVSFLSKWIVPGGYIAFHDYRPLVLKTDAIRYCPDVIDLVDSFKLKDDWEYIGLLDSIAVFRKKF